MSLNLDVPRTLAGGAMDHLSHSAINTYLGCSERFRRRYLELEYEPTNQKMLCGKVVGNTVAAGYIDKIASGVVNAELLTDTFDTQWTENTQEEVDWEGLEPGQVKDAAADSLLAYAPLMAAVDPVTVEESFSITLPDAEWETIGYLDWVTASPIYDLKVSAKTKTQDDLDYDAQATLYIAAKAIQEEGARRPFRWHAITRPSPKGNRAAFVTELETTRTTTQINAMLERVALVAREIDHRVTTGDWQGAAPGYWLCSQKGCGYFDTCRFGGLR